MQGNLIILLSLVLLTLDLGNQLTPVRVVSNSKIILEDFQNDTIDDLPANWFNRDGNRNPINYEGNIRDEYQYRIVDEKGRKFLRYEGSEAKHLLLPLGGNDEIDLRITPVLSWQWRVHQLPVGGNEDDERKNDVAASIYVVWGFNIFRVPKVVRYTWSSTLSKDFSTSKNMNMQHIFVMESGSDNLGKWITFERNIVEDYKRFFRGSVPKRPVAILILSDADDTKSYSKADYDMIVLKSTEN